MSRHKGSHGRGLITLGAVFRHSLAVRSGTSSPRVAKQRSRGAPRPDSPEWRADVGTTHGQPYWTPAAVHADRTGAVRRTCPDYARAVAADPPKPRIDKPDLPGGPLNAAFSDGRRQHLRQGTILFTEGDASNRVVLLVAGRVKVSSYSED